MSGSGRTGAGDRTPANPRYDPQRAERIVMATLEVIGDVGISGTSMRKVAKQAGVPLGSVTYHFGTREELLQAAMRRHAETVALKLEKRMNHADCTERAQDAVVALIMEDMFASQSELILNQELYTLAARLSAFRAITNEWMARSRACLMRHFDADTARGLDALIEGLTLHGALGTEQLDPEFVARMVRRVSRS